MLLFQNLIDNAIKFRDRRRRLEINISARKRKNEWILAFEDNGIGFDLRHANKIFDAFERLHSSAEYEGTGIGLAMCKKIAERHGRRIWCDSTPGAGSTFFVSFPDPAVKRSARERKTLRRDGSEIH